MRRWRISLVLLAVMTGCVRAPGPTAARVASRPSATPAASSTPLTSRPPVTDPNGGTLTPVTPPSSAPGTPSATPLPIVASLEGVVLAPPGILSNNGASLISDNGGGIISNNGSGLISDNGGGLVGKPYHALATEQHPLAGARVYLLDAGGHPILGANNQVVSTLTDAQGHYAFTGTLPRHNELLAVELADGKGLLQAVLPNDGKDTRKVDLDAISTLATTYILDQYVATQANAVQTLDKLPADVEATTRADATAALAKGTVALPDSYAADHVTPVVNALRQADATFDQQMELVRKLLVVAGQTNLGSGQRGVDVSVPWPRHLLVAPDGALWVASFSDNRVWRLAPDGTIAVVAGNSTKDVDESLTGKRATEANLSFVADIALDARGRLLILELGEETDYRVSRVEADGTMTELIPRHSELPGEADPGFLVPGTGDDLQLYAGDGGLYRLASGKATLAKQLPAPRDGLSSSIYAMDAQGRGYKLAIDSTSVVERDGEAIAQTKTHTGLALDPGGNVFQVNASRQLAVTTPAGDTRTLATLSAGTELAVGPALLAPDGTAYIVTDGGTIEHVANGQLTPVIGAKQQGGQATQTSIEPVAVAVASDGAVLAADRVGNRIVRVAADGTLTTLAGTGQESATEDASAGDGQPATSVTLEDTPNCLRPAPDGTLYFAMDTGEHLAKLAPDGTYRFLSDASRLKSTFDDVWQTDANHLLACGDTFKTAKGGGRQYGNAELRLVDLRDWSYQTLATWEGTANNSASLAPAPDGSVWIVTPDALFHWTGGASATAIPLEREVLVNSGCAAMSPSGKLYIGEEELISRLDPATGKLTAIAGKGAPLLSGSGTSDSVAYLKGLTFDASGNMLFADLFNKLIERLAADKLASP